METLNVICKLDLTPSQQEALDATLAAYTEAWAWAAAAGRSAGTTSNARIHHLCYEELRRRFGLSANLAIRAIARAASFLKGESDREGTVKVSRIDYDARVLSYCANSGEVSLSSVRGRLKGIRMSVGEPHRHVLSASRPRRIVLLKSPEQVFYLKFEMTTAS